ncbi:receptor-like protein 20 [Gossypium hirsutum]|uniref:Receptor-like protein 20 n=1 Tax=Gossypium hirsutum TaxID=3635 RepID=A0A1U8IE58_GOSHI|nr:receptor-like protein 20 [Gossypium hirsutum]
MENLGILTALFFLFSSSTSLHPSSLTNLQNYCLDDQRSALLQLQHHLYYAPNFTFSSKLDLLDPNTHCCSWKGVTCDALGHIIGIDLSYQNLSEKPNFKTLIKKMRSLRELYLDGVNISSQSSEWCETTSLSLPKLSVISMSNCDLNGHFPVEFFLLPKMQRIDISDNSRLMGQLLEFPINNTLEVLSLQYTNFSGKLPESISNLKLLRVLTLSKLSLNFNSISGSIPPSIANLSNLVELDLSGNNFNGLISPFHRSGVPNLAYLDLSRNRLSGSIPSSLFTLSTLQTLSLGYNSFSDYQLKLDMFFQLNNLRFLDPSNMSLLVGSQNKILIFPRLEGLALRSCNLTEFPEFIKSQNKLTSLYLSNNRIHGLVPNWLWKSTLIWVDLSSNMIDIPNQIAFDDAISSFPMLRWLRLQSCNISTFPAFLKIQESLEDLDLSNNKISGAVPNWVWKKSLHIPDFGGATQLYALKLKDNKLEGKLPRSLANCTMLYAVNLGNNTLHDTFPLWLGKLPGLMVLILRANRFYGPIKHLENNFPTLDVLDIASNNFSGQLSIEFFQATHKLSSLKINGNNLEGKLPRSLANCKKLEVLDLGKNMIHDTFPYWLVKLPLLKVLILRSNRFYGSIKFFEDGNAFPMLHILDLASNNFSGEVSVDFFQSLRGMMVIDGNKAKPSYVGDNYYYKDSVTIVNRGFEIFYQKILTLFTCLDLSNNKFHGRILEEVQHLKSLHVLNLSYNGLFGPIPSALGSLTELESLDLSRNSVSGKIPPQLTSLTFLALLNLSYNQLDGRIPESNQFGTFSNDSYIGNLRLCGVPLTRKCNEVGSKMLPLKEDEDLWIDGLSVWKVVLMGYGWGLVIGFSIGYKVLNEFRNKWTASFIQNWNQKRRRSK